MKKKNWDQPGESYLSESIRMLEEAFDLLNEHYFESALSKSVITVQSTPSAYGHFTTKRIWKDDQVERYEINLGAETLHRPIEEVVATLIHEMVHQYCAENDIKDTSRGGTYHNKRFKKEAEKRGLIITYNHRIGFSITQPSSELLSFVQSTKRLEQISWHRQTRVPEPNVTVSSSSTRKYECDQCGMSVRATKEVNIICGDCNSHMKQV